MKTIRLAGGLVLDIDPSETGDQFLQVANNIHTRRAFPSGLAARRIAYPVSSGHAPNDPWFLMNFSLNDSNWWVHFGQEDIFAVESNNSYDVSFSGQTSASSPANWTGALLNGIPVASNSFNEPVYWDGNGSNPFLILPDWPAGDSCKAICTFKNHIFALNLDTSEGVFDNVVKWSDATEPGAIPDSWTPAADNEAGSLFLADTKGGCVAGLGLGSTLIVYKENSFHLIDYVGIQPDRIYEARDGVRSAGLLSAHCLAEVGTDINPVHFIVSLDDILLNDGVIPRSIANNRIKTFLANSIDSLNKRNSFVIRDAANRETWVCIPEAGSTYATLAFVWDESRNLWSTRDLIQVRYGTTGFVGDETESEVWDDDDEIWDTDFSTWNAQTTPVVARVVTAQENTLYLEDISEGEAYGTSSLAKYDMVMDLPESHKVVSRTFIHGTGDFSTVEARLGFRNSTEENIQWSTWLPYRKDGIPHVIEGKFISIDIRFESQATISQLQFEVYESGRY